MRVSLPLIIRLISSVFILSILSIPAYALAPGQVFNKVRDAVVVVRTLDAKGKMKGFGSGVLISSGRVATNCHVVKGGHSYQVGRGKQLVSATLYAEDGDKDICILDAEGLTGQPAQLGKASSLKVGDPVYAVGAPKGLELSLSDGIVAQLRGGPPPFIQTTAAISPGSSGGGLFDGEGRLVGLTTLYIEGGQSLNFAMPVEWVGEIKPGRKAVAKGPAGTEWLKRAIALRKLKDWQGMRDWCLKWTKSKPKDAVAWYYLGRAYGGLKRYQDEIEAYRQGLRINPEDADIWYNLGFAYHGLKRYQDAIKAYRQALHVNPKDAAPGCSIRSTYHDLDNAAMMLLMPIVSHPHQSGGCHSLGFSRVHLSRWRASPDAIEANRQALRINPGRAAPGIALGPLILFSIATMMLLRPIVRPSASTRSMPKPGIILGSLTIYQAIGQPLWKPSGNCAVSIRQKQMCYLIDHAALMQLMRPPGTTAQTLTGRVTLRHAVSMLPISVLA